jgi:hypothetical protein
MPDPRDLSQVPGEEVEIVAAHREPAPGGGHEHITRVRLADGTDRDTADLIADLMAEERLYFMRKPGGELPYLVQIRQCPDCTEPVVFA